MNSSIHASSLFRSALLLGLVAATLSVTGCTTQSAHFSPAAVAALSPTPEVVRPLDAYHLATAYVQAHPGTDFLQGSGNSMAPLYKDHTVIVTQKLPLNALQAGMTVVFVGENGAPVAHALVRNTSDGWVTMGVGNQACDNSRVTADNYMGVVVKAFEPTSSPMLALIQNDSSVDMASLQ